MPMPPIDNFIPRRDLPKGRCPECHTPDQVVKVEPGFAYSLYSSYDTVIVGAVWGGWVYYSTFNTGEASAWHRKAVKDFAMDIRGRDRTREVSF